MRSICAAIVPALTLLIAGCAAPAWMRVPDFSGWFDRENAILVEEVARADVCGTAGGESVVTVLPSLGALQAWATGRQITLVSSTAKALPESAYAVVEFGQRPNSGYGLAVSRQAGTNGADLMLKATFFEPQPGRWANDAPSSPCVMVSLPPREYGKVRVLDQTGKVRAGTEGGGS